MFSAKKIHFTIFLLKEKKRRRRMTKEQKMRTQFQVICGEIAKRDGKKRKIYFKLTKCDQWSISPTFYKQLLHRYSFSKKLQSQTERREKLEKTLSYKKTAHKNVGEIDTCRHYYKRNIDLK